MASLAAMDVGGRAGRVRAALADHGCDMLVGTSLTNVRWLTGFSGSAGMAVVRGDDLVLVTDGRYGEQARAEMAAAQVDASVEVGLSQVAHLEILARLGAGCRRVGLEAAAVTWARQREFATHAFADVEIVPTTGIIERFRAVKDDGEIARLAEAARIADAALEAVSPRLGEGVTEAEFALELDTTMRCLGASGSSFETIVASGPASAMPHHRPDQRPIIEGDLVVIDFGALVDGYHSDMTRTFVVGEPTATQRLLLDVVTAAQAAGVRAVRAGVAAHAVDSACRDVIAEAGWAEEFIHGTGHGVGLLIHEDPFLSRVATVDLEAGNVITVEPGVYLAGVGGVRVEDSVLVTENGCRPITHFPKDHACLPSPRTT
jgi:Xaa-Pro aminopeptidase